MEILGNRTNISKGEDEVRIAALMNMVGLFNRADMNSVKKDITAYHNEQVKQDLQPDDTDTTWDKFKEVLHNITKKRIPQRTIRHNNKLPWVVSSRLPLLGHCA